MIGTRTLGFAIGRGAGPTESATTSFAVGTPDDTAVPSLDGADDRPDPTDDLSANCAVSSDEASKFRGDAEMRSLPFIRGADVGFCACDIGCGAPADKKASWGRPPGGISGTRLGSIRRCGYDAAPSPED